MNPWKSISGAVCLNVFYSLVESEPKKIDDLILPLTCCLYLSDNWSQLNFSQTDTIEDLRAHVPQDILEIKDIILANPKNITTQVNSYLDHLNGSLAFAVVIVQALYNGNQNLYANNMRTLFQESWEIIFWFIQDLKDDSARNVICDYTDHHQVVFDKVLAKINTMNPL